MRRRRSFEHPVSHERWLVSYADFITLLFAFFVVMYSISQVNESQYRVLSNTLTEAFNLPEFSRDPIQIGRRARSSPINLVELEAMVAGQEEREREQAEQRRQEERFREVGTRIEQALGGLIEQEVVSVRGTESWLEIELPSALLFESGEAQLNVPAMELLGEVAGIVAREPYTLRVEGFTDSVPINTPRFPSNWELSAARAAAVVRLFAEEGIDPARMAATGYGEHRPVADNATPEGRARNRRVLVKLSRHLPEEADALTPREAISGPAQPEAAPAPIPEPGEASRQRAEALVERLESRRRAQDSEATEPAREQVPGVRAIPLEGGGLLFTRDADTE